VKEHSIKGKRTYDIRLLAAMQFYQISHLLTFNDKDFISLPDIQIINPQKNI
jgi:predicted nucleic acid-binding protein